MTINIDTMRMGFIKDSDGKNLLPITHINLIIGDDGKSICNTFKKLLDEHVVLSDEHKVLGNEVKLLDGKVVAIDGKLSSVQTYDQLLAIDTSTLMDGAIAYVIEDKKYYSYTSGVWELMTTGSDGTSLDGYSHIWVGPTPPEDVNMIWIDTSSDGIADSENDYKTLLNLLDQVAEMQIEIINLKDRVRYLEENGVVVDPDYPGDSDEPSYDGYDIVLLEDGLELLLEDGTPLILEIQTEKPVGDTLLFENGSEILLEDGNNLLLER